LPRFCLFCVTSRFADEEKIVAINIGFLCCGGFTERLAFNLFPLESEMHFLKAFDFFEIDMDDIDVIAVESIHDQLPITVKSSQVTAQYVRGYKRHLTIVTKELHKIVSAKNYGKVKESIRLLTQIDEEANRKYEQSNQIFLKIYLKLVIII